MSERCGWCTKLDDHMKFFCMHPDMSVGCCSEECLEKYTNEWLRQNKETSVKALDTQEGGNHYKDMKIQPVEFIMENGLDYLQGNVIKYTARFKNKNGVEDLRKARHYIDMMIERETDSPE